VQGKGKLPLPCPSNIEILPLGSRQHSPLPTVKPSQRQLRKIHPVAALIDGQQADGLAPQHFAHKDIVLLPAEVSVTLHPQHLHRMRVLRLRHLSRIRPRRGHLQTGWRLDGFVRAATDLISLGFLAGGGNQVELG